MNLRSNLLPRLSFAVACSLLTLPLSISESAQAGTLSGGPLNVVIRGDNGAINNASFNQEFYRLGIFVSDYGFQLGEDPSTFGIATTEGSTSSVITNLSTTSGSDLETVNGKYSGGEANIDFTKEYSLIDDAVLKTKVTLTNAGNTTANALRYFFTADPDQGDDRVYDTINDTFELVGGEVAQANSSTENSKGSVVIGSGPSPSIVGFGSGGFRYGIDNGFALNQFFQFSTEFSQFRIYDPEGGTADVGFAIVFERNLLAGESTMFNYYQAFGDTPENARAAFVAAVDSPVSPTPVPTPALFPGLIGMGIAAIRKHKQQVIHSS